MAIVIGNREAISVWFSLRKLCVLGGSAVKEFAKPNNFSQKPSSLFVDSVTYNSLNRRDAANAEIAQRVQRFEGHLLMIRESSQTIKKLAGLYCSGCAEGDIGF